MRINFVVVLPHYLDLQEGEDTVEVVTNNASENKCLEDLTKTLLESYTVREISDSVITMRAQT